MITRVSRRRHKGEGGAQSLPSQIAQQFRNKIESGEWRVGSPVPTTRQLAKDYRVSLNTVQSAFRELQASNLIERVPRRGGFVKARSSDIAGAARAKKGTLVGIVTPFPPEASEEQGDDWSKRIIHAAEGVLLENGLHLSMFSYPVGDNSPVSRILSRVDQMGADLAGMICFARPAVAGLTTELDSRSIPWISINRAPEQSHHNFVTAGNFHGGRSVGRCFAKLGFDRVVILANGMEPGSSSGDKFFGFIQGYMESGKLLRGVDYVPCADITGAVGYEMLAAYMDKYGPPQGIFTTGDYLALGAMRLCRERGIHVPERVGVVGATGLHVAAYAHPSLTVLSQPMEQMGEQAAKMLLKIVHEGVPKIPGQYIPSPFIFRDSLIVPEAVQEELEIFTQARNPTLSARSEFH